MQHSQYDERRPELVGSALRKDVQLGGRNIEENTSQPLDLQAAFIARRFNLDSRVARIIASLAFGARSK